MGVTRGHQAGDGWVGQEGGGREWSQKVKGRLTTGGVVEGSLRVCCIAPYHIKKIWKGIFWLWQGATKARPGAVQTSPSFLLNMNCEQEMNM